MATATNILVVDIGNTSTSVARARGLAVGRVHWAPTRRTAASEEAMRRLILQGAEEHPIEGAVVSSVVPAATNRWTRMLRRCGVRRIVRVHHQLRLGVELAYPRPQTIGADRLANACEAWARCHQAAIVADFGTALTFDVISNDGAYCGGVIAPGLPMMTDYLARETALLPRIRLEGRIGHIGKSTAEAMRIGARIGYRGMVREIVEHVQQGLGGVTPHLWATGGHAGRVLRGAGLPFAVDPKLTLKGLARIYEMNRPQ